MKQLEAMGGIRYRYLTHRDDVADHQAFHDHFGCDRILHTADLTRSTQGIEWVLTGRESISLAEDVAIIPVPDHTPGHTVLLYANEFLVTGDHLAWSKEHHHLIAFQEVCWYSWAELKQSMKQLATYSFTWVLPGHGRRYSANRATMQQQMETCLAWMETV